jgi:hypothetical protein
MIDDPVLEEIWEARRKISARCDNDPYKLVAYYIELEKQNPHRLLQERGGLQQRDKAVQENLPVEAAKEVAA